VPDEAGEAAEPDPWLGRVVDARYRVLARVGSGGMGVVYRVEHLRLGKIAAMKMLSPATAGNREMVQRFRREAQAVSRLNHPNIVQTFDFGQWDGALYLVMEYVKGDDLSALLRRDGALPFARAARLFVQVCSALTEAHDSGIIHRDLKPENLMVIRRRDGSEHAKVLDFGLAKLREREDSAAAITSGAQVLGTPYYMAPEQVRGEALDPRADVYSLGATLYRVLTGAPPFLAPSPMSVLAKHLTEDVVPPRERAPDRALPPEADRIVLRAMAKALPDRYESAAAVQADLERALAGAPAVAVPPAPALPLPPAHTIAVDDNAIAGVSDAAYGGDVGERLRRRDLENFERSLRRRHLLVRIALPLAVLGSATAVVLALARGGREKADTVEHEPNNTPGYANLLPLGVPVRGTIGKLIEGTQPDVDFFRVPAGRGPRAVTARLEGVPGIDLVLELFDAQGRRLAKSDAYGRGWGEWLQPTTIGPAEAYVAVRELWVQGEKPAERPDAPYTLTVKWAPPQPGWEVEPNDWETAATPIPASRRIRGYLAALDDVDWFTFTPAADGRITFRASVPEGVDVVLLREGAAAPPDPAHAVNRRGAGGEEELTVDAVAGRPVHVGLARKPLAKKRDPKDEAPPGLDEPYELVVE
jgi:serine/threonine-protein kinase